MIKQILIAGLLIIVLSGVGSAWSGDYYCWNNGHEYEYYSNTGDWISYHSSGHDLYIHWTVTCSSANRFIRQSMINGDTNCAGTYHNIDDTLCWGSTSCSGCEHITGGSSYRGMQIVEYGNFASTIEFIVSPYATLPYYNVTGNTSCVSKVELHRYNSVDGYYYEIEDNTTVGSYSFDVLDNYTYRLYFKPGSSYTTFTVNGSDEIIDVDDCTYTKYRFEETCGNLIPDSEGYYQEWDPDEMVYTNTKYFHAPDGILDIVNSSATAFIVYTDTFIGRTGWHIDPVVPNATYTLTNPNIDWKLKVIVQNESDGELIEDAMVKIDQSCYCTSGNSTRQKKTVSGMSQFEDMSLQDASLFVMASGYKILEENSTGYNVFLSGRAGFDSKTWIVKMANSSCNNSSTWYESAANTSIFFKDVDGNRTSQILDTDAYVDLYYSNNNTDESNMTLKFQSTSTHTYFIDERTYDIPWGESGYKRITTGYFTPQSYSYRAIMYNSSIYGWNITIPLTVRNGTSEEEHNYQNLTTNMWVVYAEDGKIDYREDIRVAVHAKSINTTLMAIDVELWDNGVYKKKVNLTAMDFSGASIPYLYIWSPSYNYESGHNYSVRMYGYDRTLLKTDYVECITDTVTRKNKITIKVKDRAGNNLDNAYVYLEDWGSLSTGSTNYNVYDGITNGDYRYKATKSGYTGGGWEEVTVNDGDEFVVYTLTGDYTNTSMTAQKFGDEEIKSFFFPLMYFLMICIVLGGLKYVTQ